MKLNSPELEKFIALLSYSELKDYNTIFETFDFKSINFKPYETWSSEKYTRNCLYRDTNFELILICWNEGQETPVHNHDGEDCWVHLLQGEMQEVFYNLDLYNTVVEEDFQIILAKQTSHINDKIGLHKLKNNSEGKTMSLHLYAKPIDQCRSYDEDSGGFVENQLSYDTDNGVKTTTKL